MPIKFRCEYCRQLLGIAENKAGSLVDCPTCGRTLRVPNRDGTVEPPPKPGVNLADDGLRRALDELALIGRADEEVPPLDSRPTPPARPAVIVQSTDVTASSPNATAAPAIQAPPSSNVNAIALEPLPPMKVVDPPHPVRAAPAIGQPHSPASMIAEASSEEVLADLAEQAMKSPVTTSNSLAKPVSRGVPLRWVIVASGLSLFVGGAGGFGVGRYLAVNSNPAPTQNTPQAVRKTAVARPQVKGRLTFRNAQKQPQPDSGASVLILPMQRNGEKLATMGFRPNDDDKSHQAAAKLLAGQGGRLARTDDDGNFAINLPHAEEYHIIGLSHFQGRPADDSGSADSLKILEEFFDRPEQLVGKLAFHVASIKHTGTGTVIWDHTFGE